MDNLLRVVGKNLERGHVQRVWRIPRIVLGSQRSCHFQSVRYWPSLWRPRTQRPRIGSIQNANVHGLARQTCSGGLQSRDFSAV
jgi:hypothetical protein